jgi:hypothetical protein
LNISYPPLSLQLTMRISILNVGPKLVRVEPPITKHILITKHFKIFSSSLNQIERFSCHRTCKLEGHKWSLSIRGIKEQHRKHRKRMSDSLFQFFWKYNTRPLSPFTSKSFSFLICFEWFKIWWVHQLRRLYKASFHFKGKDATIKDLKLKILICSNSLITKH